MAKEKATLTMLKMQKQLEEPKAKPKAKKSHKKSVEKKEAEAKTIVPDHTHKEEKAATHASDAKDVHIPRGERGDFLKTTITISAELLTELRALGMRRKSAKQLNTDTSSLVREALVDFLKKHKTL